MRVRQLAFFMLLFGATAAPVLADPRDVLRDCEALLARAAQSSTADKPGEADIVRCRQVVRDWTLRESRMLVDEQGRPIR